MVWWSRATRSLARIEVLGAINGEVRNRVLNVLKTVKERKYPALLLRIDSPGGTVGDSQEIYSALRALQQKVKIVASFGNISASGGVYIGMGASHIVANAGTVTGSIGVILRGNNLEILLKKIGISFKVIKSGPYKDILAFDRDLTDSEQSILQELIDTSYCQFVQTVAEARQLTEEQVRAFADGRIFTGQQAQALGVVDRLGSEEDARRWACELVGLDPDKTRTCTLAGRPRSWLPRFSAQTSALQTWLDLELQHTGVPLWLYRP